MRRSTLLLVLLALGLSTPSADAKDKIDFNREILPLLSDNCFRCHGPDQANREAGLRLDQQDAAFAKLESGETAIVPGKSAKSALFQRIVSKDPDAKMPPEDSGKHLTPAEIQLIKRWIDEGANWAGHWAFEPPARHSIPAPVVGWRVVNPVDLFIQGRLKREGLKPSPKADRETLIRRVTLDLTGLPPTVEEIDAFLADRSPLAYERLVDRLLESNKYGEHMGRIWLDAARFADTHGLHLDNERSIWPYRDWVIKAFNDNMRFDHFTIEQLAGDLLPKPTLAQRVATGFNRCNVTTSEGGSIDEEYYVRYAVDRVETTSTVWLGLTAGCAACHDHKFDPLTQKEFYQLFSYFYSLTERAMDGNALLPPPIVKVPSRLQVEEQSKLESAVAAADKEIQKILDGIKYKDPLSNAKLEVKREEFVWIDDKLPEGAKPQGNGDKPWKFVSAPDHPVLAGKHSTTRTGTGITQHFFTDAKKKLKIGANDRLFAYVYIDKKNPPQTVQLQFNDGSWEHRASWGEDKAFNAGKNNASNRLKGKLPEAGKWVRLEVSAAEVGLKPGSELNGWAFTQVDGTVHWDKAGIVRIAPLSDKQKESLALWEAYQKASKAGGVPGDIQKVLDTAKNKRTKDQIKKLTRYFLQNVSPAAKAKFAGPIKSQADSKKRLADLVKAIPGTLVMEDRKKPRQAYILERGQYTEQRDKVASQVPTWISPALPEAPSNRLGLAQWLVNPKHPLTSRVTVNRYWQHFFGTGIVKTSEDFGVQGARPTHPELLDWLALRFIDSGWNIKEFHKMLVMSATYQQSSRVTTEGLEKDADNLLLARGPRFRLDAEVIRDQALAMSGLLVETIGGRSVKPYQPAGLWKPVGFGGSNTSVFKQDRGSKLYRRSMYTFWKRTSPPPTMSAFDAPDRETCQVRRARTNTPLQALVLMNDVQLFEAARKLAERVMKHGSIKDDKRAIYAFRTVTSRRPSEKELKTILTLYREYLAEFRKDPKAAKEILAAGESPQDKSLDEAQLGAWTMISHLLMNLSETITKG